MADRGGAHDRAAEDAAAARVEALLAQANQLATASLSQLDRRRPSIPPRWLAAGCAVATVVIGAFVLSIAGSGAADSAGGFDSPGVTESAASGSTLADSPLADSTPAESTPADSPPATAALDARPPGSVAELSSTTAPAEAAAMGPAASAPPTTVVTGLRALDASMLFDVDSHTLRPQALPALEPLVSFLAEHERATLEIVGHTDSAGSEQYNLALSLRRAEAVVAHLVAHGVDPARLTALGLGESQPVADNATREGRAANRRIDIQVRDASTA